MPFNWKASIIWTILLALLFMSTIFPFFMGGLGGGYFIAIVRDEPFNPDTYWDNWTNSETVLDNFVVGLFFLSLGVFKITYALVYVIGMYYINSDFFDAIKNKLVTKLLQYRINVKKGENDE